MLAMGVRMHMTETHPPALARPHACLAGMMAAEQSCLDQHWKTAWRLTGLEAPPWQEWAKLDAGQCRRENHKSKLAEAKWVATIIAELKDEDFLMKRRGGPPAKGGGKGEEEGR